MKRFTTKMGVMLLLPVIVLTHISANKSNWAGLDLSPEEINNSVHFQVLRGSTCVGEFDNVKPVINRFIQKNYNPKDLQNVLGQPNETTVNGSQKIQHYYLSSNPNQYRLQVVINNDAVVSYSVKDYE